MTTLNPYAISARDLEKLVREFAEDVCELLLSYPKTAEFARKLKARLASVFSAQMSKEPIVGVLLGPQGAGKSKLLNEIVGETCAPIDHTGTGTTETINRFQYGSEKQSDKFRVHWHKREHEDRTLEDVNEALKDWIAGGKNVSETALIDFFVNSEFLRSHNIALIDTPGTGSTKQHLDAEIQQFLHGEHAATTQHGVIPHVLIYVISDVHPATVRSIRTKFGEYKQALGILPEASIIVVQSSDGNAERKCELLREEFGSEVPPLLLTHETEALQKQLSYLPDAHLLKVLTVYRIVSNVYEKAVASLKDSVEAEEAHKQRGEKFRDSLKPENSLKSETGITASESRKILQTIVSHLRTLRELRESLESDLQKRQELVENFRKVLEKTREEIRPFRAAAEAFRQVQAKLEADWKQEEQRVEDSSHTWKEALAATPQIVRDLETLENYINEAARPTIRDIYETSENYLNDLIPSIEKRIAQINQLLENFEQTKAKIEENAHLFEEDIRCLNLLNTLGDSEITNRKKQELQCLFGQNGTSISRRLRISNGSTSEEKQDRCWELLEYWEDEGYKASSNELNQILDHATFRLGTIYEVLSRIQGENAK